MTPGGPAEPYVTKALLLKLFGPTLAAEVAARYFLEGQGPGGFRFRPEYLSEKVMTCAMAGGKTPPHALLPHIMIKLTGHNPSSTFCCEAPQESIKPMPHKAVRLFPAQQHSGLT